MYRRPPPFPPSTVDPLPVAAPHGGSDHEHGFRHAPSAEHFNEAAWAQFLSTYGVGDTLDGQVVTVMPFGACIDVGGGVHGLAPASEWPTLPGVGRCRHPDKGYHTGRGVHACCRFANACRPSVWMPCARNSTLRTLPVTVTGNDGTTRT